MSQQTARTAVVTGGAKGIGAGIVDELLANGHRVLAVDNDVDGLATLVADRPGVGDNLVACEADISSERGWGQIMLAAHESFGPVGVLVNNAAISPKRDGERVPSHEMSRDEWDRVLAVNMTGPFLGFQSVIDDMRSAQWGRIVNISSTAGRTGARLAGIHYGVAKTGILGLTRTLAWEYGGEGITVNAVAPGRIMTPMAAGVSDDVNAALLTKIPVGRFGYPEDIASVVAFLVSDGAGFVTGATIDSNGGAYMT